MIVATSGTILLVEDDPNDALLMQRALRRANLENRVQILQDGEAAILYLSGQTPYADRTQYPVPVLAVLDLKLPRRSGLEVLAWIRQQETIRRLPVVIFTSSTEKTDVNRAYDLGVNSYLVKPVNFDALVGMVKMLDMYWLTFNEKPTI
jgi:DNA-binding response OmpR family regulator